MCRVGAWRLVQRRRVLVGPASSEFTLAFPQSRTIAANYEVKLAPYPDAGSCVLVWNARNAGDAVPSAITRYVQQIGAGAVRDQPHYVEALLNRSSDRMDRFGYLILSDADANCRR